MRCLNVPFCEYEFDRITFSQVFMVHPDNLESHFCYIIQHQDIHSDHSDDSE